MASQIPSGGRNFPAGADTARATGRAHSVELGTINRIPADVDIGKLNIDNDEVDV